MDDKKLWKKISGSITFYLKSYDEEKTDEELLKDYLDYALPDDMEDDGLHRYLDKQTYEFVVVNDELVNKAKNAFMERLQKRRLKENKIYSNENENIVYINKNKKVDVIDFMEYKKNKED